MVINTVPTSGEASVDGLLRDFANYLDAGRGVRQSTIDVYVRLVRKFFGGADGGDISLGVLTGPAVRDRVTALGATLAPASLKLVATAVRAFLRFVWVRGLTSRDLSGSVGPVIVHRSAGLPKALSSESARALLAAPERGTVLGNRDYAVLLMLLRFGLRASEAAGLCLDDIDWVGGTFSIRVKGGSRAQFPLPVDVGEALVEYLRVRPDSVCRQVFLTVRGTARPMSKGAVTQVVHHRAERAGLGQVRAHRLRHTAARQVLTGGGTFREVGELLGHTSDQTVRSYSSFDLDSLAALARPWPTEARDA